MLSVLIVQVGTGFSLAVWYVPSVANASLSVESIVGSVSLGWLMRSLHRWSSSVMITVLSLHVLRVYLTEGFKKPRELIWCTGMLLSVPTCSLGVTGYSLSWDQVGYWALKVVTAVPDSLNTLVPSPNTLFVFLLRGAPSCGQGTMTRFYTLHTFVFPLFAVVFLSLHFIMIRKQGISGPLQLSTCS